MTKRYTFQWQPLVFFLLASQMVTAQDGATDTINNQDPKIEVTVIKAQQQRPEPVFRKAEPSQADITESGESTQVSFAQNGARPTTSVGVGNTPAQLSVSPTGAATYSLPFALPRN